jgi:hypothetical protein
MTAFVVAMAGMMLPAMAVRRLQVVEGEREKENEHNPPPAHPFA